MGKLNIAQNERLCYFKQLFPTERILDLNFKNLGSVPALPLSMSVITGKLFPLLRTWFPHLQNGNTGTSCMVCKPRSMLYFTAVCTLPVCWCQSDPSLAGASLRAAYIKSPGLGKSQVYNKEELSFVKKLHMKVLCLPLLEYLWCLLMYSLIPLCVPHWAGPLKGTDTSTALQALSTESSSRWALLTFWQDKCLRCYYTGPLSQK